MGHFKPENVKKKGKKVNIIVHFLADYSCNKCIYALL